MILQCDQCQTKFRLDDSKLKPGGVKVRCSKCRHVFIAGAEPKQEESDFDAILSGLGGPAPEKREEGAAPSEEEGGFSFEPTAMGAPAAAPAAAPTPPTAPAEPTPAASAPAAAGDEFPDFSSFDFNAAPSAAKEESPVAKEPPAETTAAPDFNFDMEEPVVRQEQDAKTPPAGLDFGEFTFDEEAPAAKAEEAAPKGAGEDFDFGEFPFEAAAPVQKEEPAAAPAASGLDFGEFEFNPEPIVKKEEAPAAPSQELDFGELTFNEEAPAQGAAPAEPAAAKEAFEFGDFNFEEEPPPIKESPAPGPSEEFGTFSFTDELQQKEEKPAAAAPQEEFSLGDFSFEEAPKKGVEQEKPIAPSPVEEFALGEFTFMEEPAPKEELAKEEKPAAAAHEEFAPGNFPFTEGFTEAEAPSAAEPAAAAGFGVASSAHEFETETEPMAVAGPARAETAPEETAGFGVPPVPPVLPAEPEKGAAKGAPFDFDFGEPIPPRAEGFQEEEELPPLGISSRRKGRNIFMVAIVTLAALFILALTGAGIYVMQKGPAAVQTFNKMGLGFVGKWFGVETPEEGRITVKNPLASFYQNKEAGEVFVVTGDAVNGYRKPRASIHVKVSIFDKKGQVIMQKTAYCGNRLTKDQLENLPMAKIDAIMNNQFGDSLSNLGVKPGQSIGFVVALPNVPKDAADFGVEVVGSTVAGQ